MQEQFSTKRLVDGYHKAFIDSSIEADSSYSPQFISNSNGKKVLTVIENELKGCDDLFISVAFITMGGIAPLLGTLKDLEDRGAKGRILTTDYLMFSDPKALDKLNGLSNLDVRVFKTAENNIGFHTKGYMFHNNGDLRIIVGSSNLTQSALSTNHEWNTRMVSTSEGQYAKDIESEFNSLWESSVCYDEYREEYMELFNKSKEERAELNKLTRTLDLGYSKVLIPNRMQEEFTCNIEKIIHDGGKRAMLISATGTGKTFASAFAVRKLFSDNILKNKKALFLSHRWDRFSRNPEFAYMFKRMFLDEWGIEFNALESPIDFSATEWSSLLSSYCAAAHTENNKISRRTRDGIRETMLSGRWANSAPRGYKNVHIVDDKGITVAKTIEVDETKAPIIRVIFQEVGKGVEAPCAIRRRLAPEIPESTFLDMLRNIFYKGKIRVPATDTEPEVIVDGLHEPLVTEELFDRVQDIMDGKRRKQPKLTKPLKPEYYLRKFLVCPHCGRAITGATSKGGSGGEYHYYFCPTTGKHLRMQADALNDAFVDYVSGLRPNEAVMRLYYEILNDLRKENARDIRAAVDKLDNEIQELNTRMDKIEDKYLDGEIEKEDYTRMINRVKQQMKNVEDRKELLETPNRGKVEPKLKYSINLIDNIDKFFQYAPAEAKIRALSSIFSGKLEFDGEKFRTDNLNSVLDLIYQQTNELRGENKKSEESFSTFPASVPRPGIEPGWVAPLVFETSASTDSAIRAGVLFCSLRTVHSYGKAGCCQG